MSKTEKKPDGCRAFACADNGKHQPGMSLRDYFAGQAMNAYGAHPAHDSSTQHPCIAEYCYKLADAMIAEREK